MKVILAAVDPFVFYKLYVDFAIIEYSRNRKYVEVPIYCLNDKTWKTCRVVGGDGITANVGEDNILEEGDCLSKIPDVYLTRRFRIMVEEAKKYLSEDEKKLVELWNNYNNEKENLL